MNLTFDGVEYVIATRMSAFTQLKVARRLGPAVQMIAAVVAKENIEKDKKLLSVLMFSYMPEDSMMAVVNECLTIVHRRISPEKTSPVVKDGILMFDDITLDITLKLAMEVIEDNLGDFFRTALAELDKMELVKS